MIGADSIAVVLDVLRPERAALLALLDGLEANDWRRPTEYPAYTIMGVATHVLGDDLSLLSRQRDGAENGLIQLARDRPGADFRTLLDSFNDRWVAAAAFLSTELVVELLRLAGEWTAAYYGAVDPDAPGESVGFFGGGGSSSPNWQAIAREYVERWVHQRHDRVRRLVQRRRRLLRPVARRHRQSAGAVSFRLVDDNGIAFEPEPRTGRYGVDLAGWADFEGVPEHTWWNLRHPPPEDDGAG